MGFLVVISSPTSCHFVPLKSKYLSQRPVFKYPCYVKVLGVPLCLQLKDTPCRGDDKDPPKIDSLGFFKENIF